MAGVMNNTARQFNLKCISPEGHRVTVRVAPGFNVVDDNHWREFVSKDGKKVDPYVAKIKKLGYINFGEKIDDLELDQDSDTKSKSKSVSIPKGKGKDK